MSDSFSGDVETRLRRHLVVGVAQPEGNGPDGWRRCIDHHLEVLRHRLHEVGPRRRPPIPVGRGPILMIPVFEVMEGGAELGRGSGILLSADTDDVGPGSEDPRALLPRGDRVHRGRTPGERGHHRRSRVGLQQTGTAQGHIIQMGGHGADSGSHHPNLLRRPSPVQSPNRPGAAPVGTGLRADRYSFRVAPSTRTRYATCSDVEVAYQVLGDGPIDILLYTGGTTPIDCVDEEPAMARFQRRLATVGRLIRFDRRGVGLSDRGSPSNPPTEAQWVEDAVAVLDTVGSRRAVVIAPFVSSGVGLLMAASHTLIGSPA